MPGSCKNPPAYFKKLVIYPDLMMKGTGDATELTPNSPGAIHFGVVQKDMVQPGWDSKKLWIGWANEDKKIIVSFLPFALVHD